MNKWQLLSGKTIGIYTLMESASQRVCEIIRSHNAQIHLIMNHDKAGSESLKNMVLASDVLLVATSSAKHAATIFIEKNMKATTELLRPKGKGSSSMINELSEYLNQF